MIRLLAALVVSVGAAPVSVVAFPDGAPWNAVRDPGCAGCHFDGMVLKGAAMLRVDGLPDSVAPGEIYRLKIGFASEDTQSRYGILLSFLRGGEASGRFISSGGGLEIKGAQVRSVTGPDAMPPRWEAVWQAPETQAAGELRMVLWGNMANGDGSPFGDRLYRLDRIMRLRDTSPEE